MKSQKDNNFDELIDELRSLPDPKYTKYNKQVQDNIHKNLMNYSDNAKKSKEWSPSIKKIGLGMAGLIAIMLFSILLLPQNDKSLVEEYLQNPLSGGDEVITEDTWDVRNEYSENNKVLFEISPDPNLTVGKPYGYIFSFNEPFETYEDKELAIYAYHKKTGQRVIAVQPTLITEPSPGYNTLGRFTATFEVPLEGLWRYEVRLDGKPYGDVVLNVEQEKNVPISIEEQIIQNINWEVSETFQADNYTMRGTPTKVAFIDAPFVQSEGQKYMWHFWGDIPDGKLTVVGIKKDSKEFVPVLTRDEQYVWSYGHPAGPNNGADAHLPSTMELPERGKWALLVYLGDNYIDHIVVDVK